MTRLMIDLFIRLILLLSALNLHLASNVGGNSAKTTKGGTINAKKVKSIKKQLVKLTVLSTTVLKKQLN